MRVHDHYPGCRFNGMNNGRAWRKHLRLALVGWLIISVIIYLVVALLVVGVKVLR